MLIVLKSCDHLHKCHSNLILNKAKCIDSLIAINIFSLAAFPLFTALSYTGKAAKLKLLILLSENLYTLLY